MGKIIKSQVFIDFFEQSNQVRTVFILIALVFTCLCQAYTNIFHFVLCSTLDYNHSVVWNSPEGYLEFSFII